VGLPGGKPARPEPKPVSDQAITRAMAEQAAARLGPDVLTAHFTPAASDEKPDIAPPPVALGAMAIAEDNPDEAVSVVHEKAAALTEKDLTFAVRQLVAGEGADVTLEQNGRRNPLGQTESGNLDAKRRQQRKQADRAMQDMLLHQLLTEQIAAIDAQIAANNERIDELEAENAEMMELKAKIESGDLDPSNPQDAALMARYGITQDDIDNGTAAKKLQDQIDANQSEIDGLKQDNADLQATKAEAEKKLDEISPAPEGSGPIDVNTRRVASNGETIDFTEQQAKQAVAEYMAENPGVDLARLSPEEAMDIGVGISEDIQENLNAISTQEADNLGLQLQQITAEPGSAEYIAQVDALIDGLDDPSKKDLLRADDTDGLIKDRIRIDYFEEKYAELQPYRDEADYNSWLKDLIHADIDDRTKELLLADPNTPDDVRQILEAGPNPDTDHDRVAAVTQAAANGGTDMEPEELQTLIASLTEEERSAVENDPATKAFIENLENAETDRPTNVEVAAAPAAIPGASV